MYDIFAKLMYVQYLTLIDAISGYHNLTLDKNSSYMTTFACQFRKYSYGRLLLVAVPEGDILQKKTDKIMKELLSIYGIGEYILIVSVDVDGADHDITICSTSHMKFNKQVPLWAYQCPFLWEKYFQKRGET